MPSQPSTTPHEASAPLYLTIPEAAARLNVSRRAVERMIAAQHLPVHRFGRTVRIKRTTLDQVADDAAACPIPGRREGQRDG